MIQKFFPSFSFNRACNIVSKSVHKLIISSAFVTLLIFVAGVIHLQLQWPANYQALMGTSLEHTPALQPDLGIKGIYWDDSPAIENPATEISVEKVNRSTCCSYSSNLLKDICNRTNCSDSCSLPSPSIPKLEQDQTSQLIKERGFFIETSGSGTLGFRQACAVESLAYHNPDINIFVLFVDARVNDSSTSTIYKLKQQYKNIEYISINLDDYVAGTPLEHWFHCTEWRKGPYHVSHLSDGLRFLTLSKYGGYYFDLDVIQTRPVMFAHNFVALEHNDGLGSCSIHADYGHPLMKMAVEEFAADYKPSIWGHNGPDLLVRILKKWCNVTNIQSMTYIKCKGFHVLPVTSFNPVFYGIWETIFANRTSNDTAKPDWLTEEVIGVHVWNKLSYGQPVRKNSTQHYNRFARPSCPHTYSIAESIF